MREIARNERIECGVDVAVAEGDAAARDALEGAARLLGDATARGIVHLRHDLDAREAQRAESPSRKQANAIGREAPPRAARPDPVAEIRKVLDAVELVDADAAERFTRFRIEKAEVAIAVLGGPITLAERDPLFGVLERVAGVAPAHPAAHFLPGFVDRRVERIAIAGRQGPQENASIGERRVRHRSRVSPRPWPRLPARSHASAWESRSA
jgi:hypothetical protein